MQADRPAMLKLIVVTPSIKGDSGDGIATVRRQSLKANFRNSRRDLECVRLALSCNRIGHRGSAIHSVVILTHIYHSNTFQLSIFVRSISTFILVRQG